MKADMNRDRIAGSWKQFSGKLKEQWSRLTNDQSGAAAARRCQIAGRTQAQCGIVQQDSAHQLKEFRNHNRNWRLSAGTLTAESCGLARIHSPDAIPSWARIPLKPCAGLSRIG
jgi:uncharacterized protein YjbJ (UPF0337 family)